MLFGQPSKQHCNKEIKILKDSYSEKIDSLERTQYTYCNEQIEAMEQIIERKTKKVKTQIAASKNIKDNKGIDVKKLENQLVILKQIKENFQEIYENRKKSRK